MTEFVCQQTLAREVSAAGVALHHGGGASARLLPAEENTGIVFTRADSNFFARAHCDAVGETRLATSLRGKNGGAVSTVEHLLSALAARGIDNARVETSGDELPIFDGSAAPWLLLLEAAGARQQSAPRRYMRVLKPVEAAENGRAARWLPRDDDDSLFNLRIDYPHKVVRQSAGSLRFSLRHEDFAGKISRARTFCYVNDVELMRKHNRAQGGSLQNAVVFDDRRVINAEGLRYEDEFVRHKTLDAIGDCYINGHLPLGEYRAHSPGA